MENNIHLLSYLRKGLGQYIDGKNTKDGRPIIDLTVNMEGNKVSTESNPKEEALTEKTQILMVGPADVKQVNPGIISQIYPPAINTERFNSNFMPYMEFFEGDFPWRYTPLPAKDDGNCTPWLVLVAVTEDEYKLVTEEGKKKVEFILTDDRYINEVFPSKKLTLHDKLAHVQLEQDDDEDGISRLLCGSKIDPGKRITVFLLPAFETGRRSGLGMDYKDIPLDTLSWEGNAKEFPVYYHWSYNTESIKKDFEDFANKLDMQPESAYNDLKANLTVDIAESGLANDGLDVYRDRKEECVIDVPAALKLALGNQKDAREEPNEYKESLKKELELNSVFYENVEGELLTNEDPWVVPPVYGARHLLSEKTDLEGNGVVAEVNLKLKHRIAAGMGASVVKENQEYFVHRAWQKVEKINQLNQELREYIQMQEVEQKAEIRLAKETKSILQLWDKPLSRRRIRLLVSDALPRTLHASKLTRKRISTQNVRSVASNNWQPADDGKRIIGITPEELQDLFKPQTWIDLIGSDEFKEVIANQIIEQYKQNNNWMQYLLMPYYNNNNKTICAKNYNSYEFPINYYAISEECNELYFWMNRWDKELIPDEAHTLNYYFDAAQKGSKQQKGLFPSNDYNNSANSPIYKAVYPLELHVNVNGKTYKGFVMEANLFKEFCTKMNFKNSNYIAFEYDEMNGSKAKSYKFLFPSNNEDLKFRKLVFHYDKKNDTLDGNVVQFKYVNDNFVDVRDPNVILKYTPFTDNSFYKKIIDSYLKKWFDNDKGMYPLCDEMISRNKGYIGANINQTIRKFYIEDDDLEILDRPSIFKKYKNLLSDFRDDLKKLDEIWLSSPDLAMVKQLPSFNENNENIKRVEDFGLSLEKSEMWQCYNKIKENLTELNKKENEQLYKDLFGLEQITPVKEEEPEDIEPNLEEEKQNTIETIVKKYGYTEKAQLDEIKAQIETGKLSKYPVMIYPDFLDPTFFYLRELSENYIIPSAGELTNNSVTIFNNNPKFEEAFLMGMNTEMGQELLWREYPTDQRGSYFRKFWVAAELPEKEKLETDYFDIKKIHNWKQPLGKNHVKQDAQMLVFAIKGELMQAYPKTTIYLSRYEENNKKITVVKRASMKSWLSEDTYLVGFEGYDMQKANGLYLTFQEDVTGLEFEYGSYKDYADSSKDSADLATKIINTQSVFLLPINN